MRQSRSSPVCLAGADHAQLAASIARFTGAGGYDHAQLRTGPAGSRRS
jgi:hypothetical protein